MIYTTVVYTYLCICTNFYIIICIIMFYLMCSNYLIYINVITIADNILNKLKILAKNLNFGKKFKKFFIINKG